MQKVYSEKAGELMNPLNAYIHDSLVKLEIATLECEALDLEIERVEFEAASPPRLVLRDNRKTQDFVKNGLASLFGMKTKGGRRYDSYQMQVRGVKCVWESERVAKV
ncbi:hypothetical protein [Mannheimia haemolytica]|uniref:hypothetical protein n=1 Tax=Mannheimia haemolytica TaxID=75985 RepID=UPI002EA99079|nr:hypothetical protein [Mannheimia haemolytica]